jgi:uroporphyrinogen decarboxylase
MDTSFQPDYRNILSVLQNKRPKRLPVYEHHIDAPFISKCLNKDVSLQGDNPADLVNYCK